MTGAEGEGITLAAIVTAVLTLAGSVFCLLSAIGLVRMPDTYTRIHAGGLASTFGLGFLLIAVAIDAGDLTSITRVVAAVGFLLLTTPVASHLLARAAYLDGILLWHRSTLDEAEHYMEHESPFAASLKDRRGAPAVQSPVGGLPARGASAPIAAAAPAASAAAVGPDAPGPSPAGPRDRP